MAKNWGKGYRLGVVTKGIEHRVLFYLKGGF